MIKIDLITGFLGSGKTTFIKKYAQYLINQGYKIGIIENDYGAVNVDMMLLQELMGDKCDLEMISGGCNQQTHRRRFKTKLISMGMLGYDRIIIEPSGIYDVDEFFDVLYEEPLDNWYEIGNVITIVDAQIKADLSLESRYLLASQIANAGCVVLSKSQDANQNDIQHTIDFLNQELFNIQCQRQLHDDVMIKDWNEMTDDDFENILSCGYQISRYTKMHMKQDEGFMTLYFMNVHLLQEQLFDKIKQLMNDETCGKIFRIKGFMKTEKEEWIEINATHHDIQINSIQEGQEIMIVIGEKLNENHIQKYLKK